MEIVKGGRKDLFFKKKKREMGPIPSQKCARYVICITDSFLIMDGQAEMDGWGQPEMFTLALLAPQILFK